MSLLAVSPSTSTRNVKGSYIVRKPDLVQVEVWFNQPQQTVVEFEQEITKKGKFKLKAVVSRRAKQRIHFCCEEAQQMLMREISEADAVEDKINAMQWRRLITATERAIRILVIEAALKTFEMKL